MSEAIYPNTKFAPGDKVSVEATVRASADRSGQVEVDLASEGCSIIPFWVLPHRLTLIQAAPIRAGDTVLRKCENPPSTPGNVIAVDGDEAWVIWGENKDHRTIKCSDLKRV